MITINEEELQQLTAECGVTIHDSVHELSEYERDCIGSDTAKMPLCFTVQPDTRRIDGTVHAYY
jgi:hypothetical protein